MHLGPHLGFQNFTASKSQQNLEFIPVEINIANSARFRVISKLNLPFFLIFLKSAATARHLSERAAVYKQCGHAFYIHRHSQTRDAAQSTCVIYIFNSLPAEDY